MADAPRRIQRKRIKGFRLLPGTICVNRPSIWGNEHRIGEPHPVTGQPMTAADVVHYFRENFPEAMKDGARRVLRGHDLACFCSLCPDHQDGLPLGVECDACPPCHGVPLLEWANAG